MYVITGANGFIGSAMVWQLNEKGIHDIICVDRISPSQRPELLKKRSYLQFLLKDQLWDYLNQPEAKQKITWVIHMGANSSTTETNWESLYENNTLYTQRVFEWCAQNNKNLIYASSAATYGSGELGYDDECDFHQLRPLNLYGKSKSIFDAWTTQQIQYPRYWYGLKFFNVYGPNEYHKDAMASLVYKAYHQIKNSSQLRLFKSYLPAYHDGEQMRDFVYVKDVTSWMWELMQRTPVSGVYNMGFGKARTWLDLAQAVFSSMNRDVNVQFIEIPENIRHQYQYFTEAKMSKWQSKGMSPPQWSVERGIRDYVRQYLDQEDPYL